MSIESFPPSFPINCPQCSMSSAMPCEAETVLDRGAIELKLRCRVCGHEWQSKIDARATVHNAPPFAVRRKPDRRGRR
jgi:uncharacterized Zn finger protein